MMLVNNDHCQRELRQDYNIKVVILLIVTLGKQFRQVGDH